MKIDPAIKRTRDARQAISSSVGDDPEKVIAYYIEMQKRFGERLRSGPIGGMDEDAIAEPAHPAGAHTKRDA
jgi:hypothetical protein